MMTIRVTVDVFLEDGVSPSDLEARVLAAVGGGNTVTTTETVGDVSYSETRPAKDAGGELKSGPTEVKNETGKAEKVEPEPSDDESGGELPPEEPKVEEKPRRKRRTKAQIEADRKAEEEAKAAAEAEEDPDDRPGDEKEDEPDSDEPDYAALRLKARKLAGKFLSENGREALGELLEPYEATKITGVPDEKLEEFIEALEL